MGINDHSTDGNVSRRRELTGQILEFLLVNEFQKKGEQLLRYNVKNRGSDWLVIMEKEDPGGKRLVGFCAASDMGSAVRRAYALVVQDNIKWRPPKSW